MKSESDDGYLKGDEERTMQSIILTQKNQYLEDALKTCEKKLSLMSSIPPGISFFQECIGMAGLGLRGPDLSDEDLCIGHSMSLTYGAFLYKLKNMVISEYPFQDVYKCMLRASRPGFEKNQLFSFKLNNIPRHATSIHLYKTNSKTYIWYTNPWGFEGDLRRNERDRGVFSLNYPDTQHSTWENVLDSMTTSGDIREISLAVEAYALINEQDISRMMTNWARGATRDHIISTIYLLKLIIEKREHSHNLFEILHPTESMPAVGVQVRNDGVYEVIQKCNMKLGACSVWSELYIDWATVALQSVKGDEIGVHRVLYQTLPASISMSMKEVRYLLGKYYFHKFTARAFQDDTGRDLRKLLAYYSGFYQAIGVSAYDNSEQKVLFARRKALQSLHQIGEVYTASDVLVEFFQYMGGHRFVELEQLGPIKDENIAKIVLNTCVLLVGCKLSGAATLLKQQEDLRDKIVEEFVF